MSFNELNSVEHYIIHQLSGTHLSPPATAQVQETAPTYGQVHWQYRAPGTLQRGVNEVLVETALVKALMRLNPSIAQQPEQAHEVIYHLREILISANRVGLVKANQDFREWLLGKKTMPFGPQHRHTEVRLIDFDDLRQNEYIVTHQYRVHHRETKIPDIVLLVNGLPLVVGEAKTPIRPSVSWLDGAHDIHQIYENAVPPLFVPNVLSFATEGKQLYYGAVRTPLQFWAPWRLPGETPLPSLAQVGASLSDLLHPARLLDILRYFSLYTTNKKKQRLKIITRYQQYEGANKIVARVKEGKIKKGLIWHFQGSGKSLLMLFAAFKLRKSPHLKSPTVLVLVDRTDLDTQITGTFNAADVPNVVTTESIKDLQTLLAQGTRKIIITTIHKFRDAPPAMDTRDNIIVLVDEAHRTQEGDLGRQMRAALPNACLFGLTGTPVNKADKNTFWAFGAPEDTHGYMSRYTFQEAIRDEATLPLHFEPRLVDVHIDAERLDALFAAFKTQTALSDEEADALTSQSARMAAFLKAPDRVRRIAEDIAAHFKAKVAPHGFKAMVVAPDREACVQYKQALDAHFPAEASQVVISTTAKDSPTFRRQWGLTKDQQEAIVATFEDPHSPLQFLIVTAKLLTGFDAPILQTMYLDKSLKDHTLLQAICRTNRLYPGKSFGRIVDYLGVFDDTAKALTFDEQSVQQIIADLSALRGEFPTAIEAALAHFEGVDRTLEGFEGLQAAQQVLATDTQRDHFAADYKQVARLWESLSPDAVLDPYQADYVWLTGVYNSLRPAANHVGRLLWMSLGAQTTQLMHQHLRVGQVHALDEYILDADVVEEIFHSGDPQRAQTLEKTLVKRFEQQAGHPVFQSLSERLKALRHQAELGLITSNQFLKDLCKLARETVQAEKKLEAQLATQTPQAALTDLFLELKTNQTPEVVGRIVADIDAIVRVVRFDGWQQSNQGEREVQKALRKALLKYKLHKDQVLFDRAYAYIKAYY